MTLCKLAWGNVLRASRDYLVYLVTLALGVTVFYAFNTVSMQIEYAGLSKDIAESLSGIIKALTIFLAVVMGFLMVYANNFIMKRRKKQFGLYQVLGMRRAQVSAVMTLETFFVSVGAFCIGLIAGVGLSQIMIFFTAALFRTQIANFHFFFSFDALCLTATCLITMFVVTLIFNLRVAARVRVIDLVSANRRTEHVKLRNPLISALVFIVGVVLVAISYKRLLHDGLPLSPDEGVLERFYLTTGMVVCGTIFVFFGLSGFLLKALQMTRALYWRGLNMFTLRQLSARVNTASISMAIISMVLFLAITSVSTGMSMASALTRNVDRSTPADYTVNIQYISRLRMESAANPDEFAIARNPVDILSSLNDATRVNGNPINLSKLAGDHVQVNTYNSYTAEHPDPMVDAKMFMKAGGESQPAGFNEQAITNGLSLIKESDYNRYLTFRGMNPISLGGNSYLMTCDLGDSLINMYNAALKNNFAVTLGSHTLHPAQPKVNTGASTFLNNVSGLNVGKLVVPDAVIDDLQLTLEDSYLLMNYASGVDTKAANAELKQSAYGFISQNGKTVAAIGGDYTKAAVYEGSNNTNGLISYLSIYIGFVLVVACGAILTIQHLSGTAEAAASWRMLSELGCDECRLRRSLFAQQSVFFAFPLVVGLGHAIVALKVALDAIRALGTTNLASTAGLTVAIFIACYGGYFVLTYLMGVGIMRDVLKTRGTH